MKRHIGMLAVMVAVGGLGGLARGQPEEAEPVPEDPPPAPQPAEPPPAEPLPVEPLPAEPLPPEAEQPTLPVFPVTPVVTVHPEIFRAPSGRLLPAGHIMSRFGVDTGGGLSSGLRLGLGDVAEFGLDLTDLVRARSGPDGEPGRLFPYATASFKMGVGEDVLFRNQPALALGFRKSFERDTDGHATRFAELYLVASKALGRRADIHVGGSLWDAVIETSGSSTFLHDKKLSKQLKVFGGLEIEPLPDSSILLEVSWTPEFIYDSPAFAAGNIKLVPMFTWGVRYALADWMAFESGVRIPDIQDADLLGAQIFGQVKFISRALSRVMKRSK